MSQQRRRPQVGDRRTTKKHGLQIRVHVVHNGMWVCNGGRYTFEWRKPAQLLATRWEYLLTAEERAAIIPDGSYCRLSERPRA